jgi:hypothetical protein
LRTKALTLFLFFWLDTQRKYYLSREIKRERLREIKKRENEEGLPVGRNNSKKSIGRGEKEIEFVETQTGDSGVVEEEEKSAF